MKNTARYTVFLILPILLFSCSKTIRRWNVAKDGDYAFKYVVHDNVFTDYGWSKPDIKSREITFVNGKTQIEWSGKTYNLALGDNGNMILSSANGKTISESKPTQSSNDMYYDKSTLNPLLIEKECWVPHTIYVSKQVAVERRTINSVPDGKGGWSYYNSYYTDYVYRTFPETEWRWQSRKQKELDIPVYDYYSFSIDNTRLAVYKLKDENADKYVIQNIACLVAQDAKNLNYICADANANGSYSDTQDIIMFNMWNPYSKNSQYVKTNIAILDNFWFSLSSINEYFMTNIKPENGVVKFVADNSEFSNNKKTGTVKFSNLPSNTTITMNGKVYDISPDKKYKIQQGVYKVKIKNPNHLDFETKIRIDDKSNNQTIVFDETPEAGALVIDSIIAENYFVTITNSSGYFKPYNKPTKITVPATENILVIYTNGVSFEYPVKVAKGEVFIINFEAEMRKLMEIEKEEE